MAQRGSRLDMPIHRRRSVCLGGLVCSASPQAEKGRQHRIAQHSPSRLMTRKAETQRLNRAVSETHHQSLRSPLSSQLKEAKRTRALSKLNSHDSAAPQRCPSSIHLSSNARRLAQSEPGAHQSLVACRIATSRRGVYTYYSARHDKALS